MKQTAQQNNKAIYLKFALAMILCLVVGAALGAITQSSSINIKSSLETISNLIYQVGSYSILIGLLFPFVGMLFWSKGEKISKQAADDDFAYNEANRLVCIGLILSNIAVVWWFFSFGIFIKTLFNDSISSGSAIVFALIGLSELCWIIALQSSCVKTTKELNPEKVGNVFDSKFQQQWYASCDEAERAQIGECSYFSFRVMSVTYPVAMLLLICASTVCTINALFFVGLGVMWAIQLLSYQIRAYQISYHKNKT